MNQRMGRFAGLAGATTLVLSSLAVGGGAASATPVGAVPFSQANFNGYATGDQVHVGLPALSALSAATGVNLNSVDQGLSSASTSTLGLTSNLTSELGTLIQPAQAASVHAFNEGAGLQVDLGSITNSVGSLVNNLKTLIPLPSISIAPPDSAAAINQIGPVNLDPVLDAAALTGEAQAAWPGTSCPTGNLSYGLGNAAGVHLLNVPGVSVAGLTGSGLTSGGLTSAGVTTVPVVSTTGNGTSVSQSKSLTSLVSNGDGSYGIQTQASDIMAPITLNVLGLAQVEIAVHSAGGVNDPVTLTSTTSGEKSVPASLKLSTDDILDVTLTALGKTATLAHVPLTTIGQNGLHIPLSISGILQGLAQIDLPSTVTDALNQIITGLSQVGQQLPAPLGGQGGAVQTVLGQLSSAVTGPVSNVLNTVQTTVNTITSQPTVAQLLGLLEGTLNLNLGSIDVDTFPHAIGGNWNDPAVQKTDGTAASGALDLLKVNLGLKGSSINIDAAQIGTQLVNAVNGLIPIPAGAIPNIGQFNLPAISIPLSGTPLDSIATLAVDHLETSANQQQPIACTTSATQPQVTPTTTPTPPVTHPPALPFTGGPGGLWQPVTGVGLLGVGGGALALVRRMRRKSAV
jgi:hypothetical protein